MSEPLPPPMLIAGAAGLDFLNSIAKPVDQVVEWIGNGLDYLSWLKQAGLIEEAELGAVKKKFSGKELDHAAAQARELREWFRGFVLARQGRKLPPAAFAEMNRLNPLLEADELFWKIVPDPSGRSRIDPSSGFQMDLQRRWRTSKSLLVPIAREMATLVCAADFRQVKPCEGNTCTLLFLDESRRQARRWCNMAICGNRAKQAEHRKRAR